MHDATKGILQAKTSNMPVKTVEIIIISTIIKLSMHYQEHAHKHTQTSSHRTKRNKYKMQSLTIEELQYITMKLLSSFQ